MSPRINPSATEKFREFSPECHHFADGRQMPEASPKQKPVVDPAVVGDTTGFRTNEGSMLKASRPVCHAPPFSIIQAALARRATWSRFATT